MRLLYNKKKEEKKGHSQALGIDNVLSPKRLSHQNWEYMRYQMTFYAQPSTVPNIRYIRYSEVIRI